MGRSSKNQSSLGGFPELWPEGELPRISPPVLEKDFKSIQYPVWTQNKARLIQAYLQLFQMITKHGVYIDGFAAPQTIDHSDMWAAQLVLEMEPKWFREFWLCDIKPRGIKKLEELRSKHLNSNRHIHVVEGDFNETVREVLQTGTITDKTATFALLDQRTFECEWRTVVALSQHKSTNKIELFYFFPTGWIDRSLAAVRSSSTIRKVSRWWGRDDWHELKGMDMTCPLDSVSQVESSGC